MLHTVIETTLYPKKSDMSDINKLLKDAIKKAGKTTIKPFYQIVKTVKSDRCVTIRSEAEKNSRETIMNIIGWSKVCEIYSVTTENAWKVRDPHGYTLIIDVLDGMNNFRLGIPNFSISVAILKGYDIVFGAVYQPVLDIMYRAEKDKWAYKNKQKISVNNQHDITQSTVSYIHEYRRIPQQTRHSVFGDLIESELKRFIMDRSPSNNFCLLADGKIEWIMCNQESLYDFCAGKIIAEEAGAITNYLDSENQKDTNNVFVITNSSQLLNTKLTDILKKHVLKNIDKPIIWIYE